MNYNKIKRTNAICTVPENSCASSVSVVLPEIPPTKMRFGTRVPYFGALLLLLGCCGCGMCELVVTRFSDEAGEEEVVDPSVVPVLADDWNPKYVFEHLKQKGKVLTFTFNVCESSTNSFSPSKCVHEVFKHTILLVVTKINYKTIRTGLQSHISVFPWWTQTIVNYSIWKSVKVRSWCKLTDVRTTAV